VHTEAVRRETGSGLQHEPFISMRGFSIAKAIIFGLQVRLGTLGFASAFFQSKYNFLFPSSAKKLAYSFSSVSIYSTLLLVDISMMHSSLLKNGISGPVFDRISEDLRLRNGFRTQMSSSVAALARSASLPNPRLRKIRSILKEMNIDALV
jgi:hypothetical protein